MPLSKSIDSIHGVIDSIEFDEPSGFHIRKIGLPFVIKDGAVEIVAEKLAQYIEKCANLGAGDCNEMSAKDFMNAQTIIMGFFGESES